LSVKNHSDLTDDITNDITSNGNQEITGLILQGVLNDMADSAINKLGDTVQGKLTYSSLFSISATGDIPHKSYVDGAITTAISGITIDSTPTDGSANAVSSNGVYDALIGKLDLTGGTMTGTLVTADGNSTNKALTFGGPGTGIWRDRSGGDQLKWLYNGIDMLWLRDDGTSNTVIVKHDLEVVSNTKLTNLTASTVLELDSSKNIISAAKGTAYNKNFGTGSGTVAEGNDSRITGALQTTSFTDAAVTGKVLTGYTSGAGTVASTDTILQAIQKLNGNIVANDTAAVHISGTETITGAKTFSNSATNFATSITLLDTTQKTALDVNAANTLRLGNGFTTLLTATMTTISLTATSAININSGTDVQVNVGNGRVFAGVAGRFTLAHSSNANTTDYMARQASAGGTTLNYKSGQTMVFSDGGTQRAVLDANVFKFDIPIGLNSYTVATVPVATTAGRQIYVSDESGGAVLAFSDGTNWRRVTDRAIIS
jgi:hypothetical protein